MKKYFNFFTKDTYFIFSNLYFIEILIKTIYVVLYTNMGIYYGLEIYGVKILKTDPYFYKEYTCSYEFDFENEKTLVKCSDIKEFKNLLN